MDYNVDGIIAKTNNEFYCVTFNEHVEQDKHIEQTGKDKPVCHFVVVNNGNMNKDIAIAIRNYYPFLLLKYSSIVNLKKIFLITTFPKIKTVIVTIDNIFTEFNKIIMPNISYDCTGDMYTDIINECQKSIDREYINEIIIFSKINNYLTSNTKNIINDLLKNANISIICNKNYTNDVNVNTYVWEDAEIGKIEFCKTLIVNGIFLQKSLCEKINDIAINSNLYYGSIKIDFMASKSIIVVKQLKEININNTFIELHNGDCTTEKILDGIYNLISNLNINNIAFCEKVILDIINKKDDSVCIESKHKAIVLFQLFKEKSSDILASKLSNSHIGNLSDENTKMIISYGNRATKNMKANNKYSKTKIIKNIEYIKNISFDMSTIAHFIKEHENETKKCFIDSCELFFSSITLTSWFDEMENGNCMGMLLKLNSNCLAKNGIMRNGTHIKYVTTSFISIIDYINATVDYFNKNNTAFGDLNKKTIINGMAIGEANAVIPIYINKHHWKIAQKYMKPLLGIIISHNPFIFNNGYKDIFYTIFVELTSLLFDNGKGQLNSHYITVYIAFMRTCAEICFENKYNYGIRKVVDGYLTHPLKRITTDEYVYEKICSQTLATGYILDINDIQQLILYMIEELIRINSDARMNDYVDYLLKLGCDNTSAIDDEVNEAVNSVNYHIEYAINFLISYYKMNKLMDNVIRNNNGYSKFIKNIDANYGIANEQTVNLIHEFVNSNVNPESETCTLETLCNVIGVTYNKYNIFGYVIQGIKHFKNKDRIASINNGTYIDIQKHQFTYDDVYRLLVKNESL